MNLNMNGEAGGYLARMFRPAIALDNHLMFTIVGRVTNASGTHNTRRSHPALSLRLQRGIIRTASMQTCAVSRALEH